MTTAIDQRRVFWLRVKASVASVYFATMFFVVGPGAVLFLTRDDPLATGGVGAVAIGAAVILGANLLVVKLVGAFIRDGDGTHVPIDPPRRIVDSQAYRFTRNPMYLAYIAIVIGEAILFGSVALAAYAAVLWLIAHLYVVHREEPLLEARFGTAYREYSRRVPRWF